MNIKYCCEEMHTAVKEDVIMFSNEDDDMFANSNNTTIIFKFCPFCGATINIE